AAVPAVQALAFPGFFAGPLSAADDTFRAAIFNYAGETAPLTAPADFLAFLGPALIALPVSLWHLRRPGGRPAWAILALGLLLFGPLAVMQMRWTSYVAILALPGYAWLLAGILARLDRRRPLSLLFLSSLGRTVAVLAFAVGFFLASRLVPGQGSQDPKCPLDGMARHLATEGSAEHGRLRILSYLTVASAILYRGPHEVIGTPYFRNREGGRDTLAFFGASDPERAREIVDRRRVDLVLACPADRESRLYRGDGAKPTLLDRLAAGTAPAWLRPIPLPADLAAWYRLYEVRR
ncbi:MAG: hypothetical protein QF491_07960, partial [Alphaproteobacteria bacterium]|nr:hypothetical protein [Alphaproteobacteria bacterium]